jgi:hypothetical protein
MTAKLVRRAAIGFALVGSAAPPAGAQSPHVGLSSVRAQRFGNEALPPGFPQLPELFGLALAAGDFNGDGADDLATGAPRGDGTTGAGPIDCGSVVIRYGVPGSGLGSGPAEQILSQLETGSPEVAEAGDFFGWALAACDFNGDDFDDLAVGVPREDLTLGGMVNIEDSGIVEVYHGSAAGLVVPASAVLASNGIQAGMQRLGWALACANFDLDAFDDLAVGLPGRTVNDLAGAGRIRVYPGSSSGVGAGAVAFDQDSADMVDLAEANDAFGEALATGDFDSDLFPDLAIGVPGENAKAGAVHIVRGGFDGLTSLLDTLVSEDALGGAAEAGDEFGHALATGDFDGDFFDDLAIGAPFEDLGSAANTGNVGVVYGQDPFLAPFVRSQGFDQDTILGAGNTEGDDLFGWALASGDFDGDGRDDLAIGHPLEDNAGPSDGDTDGSVTVLTGASAVGLSPARRREFVSGFEGVPGDAAEHGENFGRALGAGDFNGDGHDDLVIGMPDANQDGALGVGGEIVLYGSLFADGFESGDPGSWSDLAPHP